MGALKLYCGAHAVLFLANCATHRTSAGSKSSKYTDMVSITMKPSAHETDPAF